MVDNKEAGALAEQETAQEHGSTSERASVRTLEEPSADEPGDGAVTVGQGCGDLCREGRNRASSEDAVRACLAGGGIALFPTETFYAIGAQVQSRASVEAIFQVKQRSPSHPFPLAAASLAQVEELCAVEKVPAALLSLWPAPLTILLPLRHPDMLPGCLRNSRNEVAIRVSSHPLVRFLAGHCGILTVSSANGSGDPPVSRGADLDPKLYDRLSMLGIPWIVAPEMSEPPVHQLGKGGELRRLPSTIVRPLHLPSEDGFLEIIRVGAYPLTLLTEAGFFFRRA